MVHFSSNNYSLSIVVQIVNTEPMPRIFFCALQSKKQFIYLVAEFQVILNCAKILHYLAVNAILIVCHWI